MKRLEKLNPWWETDCKTEEPSSVESNEIAELAQNVLGQDGKIFYHRYSNKSEIHDLAASLLSRGLHPWELFSCPSSDWRWLISFYFRSFYRRVSGDRRRLVVILSQADSLKSWYDLANYIRRSWSATVVVLGATPFGCAALKSMMVDMVQAIRRTNNLPLVRHDELLSRVARKHADYVASKGTITHFGVLGSASERVWAEGYRRRVIGENICLGRVDPQVVFSLWLKSKPHRKNLLGRKFSDFGLSIHRTPETDLCVWVLILGGGDLRDETSISQAASHLVRRYLPRLPGS